MPSMLSVDSTGMGVGVQAEGHPEDSFKRDLHLLLCSKVNDRGLQLCLVFPVAAA